jgi:hypothetical protein
MICWLRLETWWSSLKTQDFVILTLFLFNSSGRITMYRGGERQGQATLGA